MNEAIEKILADAKRKQARDAATLHHNTAMLDGTPVRGEMENYTGPGKRRSKFYRETHPEEFAGKNL